MIFAKSTHPRVIIRNPIAGKTMFNVLQADSETGKLLMPVTYKDADGKPGFATTSHLTHPDIKGQPMAQPGLLMIFQDVEPWEAVNMDNDQILARWPGRPEPATPAVAAVATTNPEPPKETEQ